MIKVSLAISKRNLSEMKSRSRLWTGFNHLTTAVIIVMFIGCNNFRRSCKKDFMEILLIFYNTLTQAEEEEKPNVQ